METYGTRTKEVNGTVVQGIKVLRERSDLRITAS